jgi:hypothetical protein
LVGRGKRNSLAGLLVLAVSLMGSANALAKPGYITFPAEREAQLTIKGMQGYGITIARIGNRVELTASTGTNGPTP